MKKYYIFVAIFLVVVFLATIATKKTKKTKSPENGNISAVVKADTIYYCSKMNDKCKDMEKYFLAKEIDKKMIFVKKETLDSEGAKDWDMKARGCGVERTMPLLFVKGHCYNGEKEVKAYFEDELKKYQQE